VVNAAAPANHNSAGNDAQDAGRRAQAARSHSERPAAAFNMAACPKTLQECAAGDDPVNISVALQIVLQGERVPYRI
jgi:hypothetical protein